MKKLAMRLVCLGALLCMPGVASSADATPVSSSLREVAVTFDDLPFVMGYTNSWAEVRTTADQLIHQLTANHIPAVGFVNESRLYVHNQLDEQSLAILGDWLNAGLELGNHTYSHFSLSRVPLEQFEQDVIRGETQTTQLLAAHRMQLRYFRHPYLQVGADRATRAAFEKFLAERGYTIAPVTINNADWVFAAAYDKAVQQGNPETLQRVVDAYLRYMEQVVMDAEGLSMELFGREIRQVLLLHANALNAAHLGELVAMLQRRGYAFIPLAVALQDKAYNSSLNTYAGPIGISWLDQWAVSVGLMLGKAEPVPGFVRGLAGLPVVTYQGY